MGAVGGKAVRMDVREISDSYRELDRYLQTGEFLDFVSRATGIPDLLFDPDYIGGGTHEKPRRPEASMPMSISTTTRGRAGIAA